MKTKEYDVKLKTLEMFFYFFDLNGIKLKKIQVNYYYLPCIIIIHITTKQNILTNNCKKINNC